jgi:hypothetical protein
MDRLKPNSFSNEKGTVILMPDRAQRSPWPASPQQVGPDKDATGPRRPDISDPVPRDLLEKMRRVNKNASRNYRQRQGQ